MIGKRKESNWLSSDVDYEQTDFTTFRFYNILNLFLTAMAASHVPTTAAHPASACLWPPWPPNPRQSPNTSRWPPAAATSWLLFKIIWGRKDPSRLSLRLMPPTETSAPWGRSSTSSRILSRYFSEKLIYLQFHICYQKRDGITDAHSCERMMDD